MVLLVETNGLLISPVSLSFLPQSLFERFDTIFIVDGGDGVVLERDLFFLLSYCAILFASFQHILVK